MTADKTDIVERLVDLHRKVLAGTRVNTENGPGAKLVATYAVLHVIEEAATEIETLRRELEEAREETESIREAYAQEKNMRELAEEQCFAAIRALSEGKERQK
jgi:5-bromo-4-chloroindolyl phosphate hydrolysis protein